MKRIFFTISLIAYLIIHPVFSFSQSQDVKEEIKAKMWGSKNPDFEVTRVDEKYKDESAVVICKTFEYEVKKEIILSFIYENYYIHERVKLQDNAAVTDYSEFEFDFSNSINFISWFPKNEFEFYLGIKVIKPDGNEIEIDIEDGVIQEMKKGYEEMKIKKIAIPDLAPGDIIDYYFARRRTELSGYFEVFEPVSYAFTGKYPIMKQEVRLHVMRRCYLNVASVNNAPELKLISDKTNDIVYMVSDKDRDKADVAIWQYPYRTFPILKFQAFFVTTKGKKLYPLDYEFLSKEGAVRENFSKEEMLYLLNRYTKLWARSWSSDAYQIVYFLRKKYPNTNDPEILTREAYYYLRQLYFRKNYEQSVLYKGGETSHLLGRIKDIPFTATLSGALKIMKIPHQVFISTDRRFTGLKDILLPNEVIFGIALKSKQKVYIANPHGFSLLEEFNPALYENKAYAIDMDIKPSKRGLKELSFPLINAESNRTEIYLTLELRPESMDSLFLKRKVIATGQNKLTYQSYIVTPYDYLDQGRDNKYGYTLLAERDIKKKKKNEILGRKEQRMKQDHMDMIEIHLEHLKSEYNIQEVRLKDIHIKELGMWEDTPQFIFEDEFSTPAFINKLGNKYLLEIGKLIGSQVELSEYDKTRKTDIHMPYARSFVDHMEVIIPEGFKPVGMEELNMDVTNETGSFKASATYENGKLLVSTTKTYNNISESKENWGKMVDFLEEAYHFSQKKILLEKQ